MCKQEVGSVRCQDLFVMLGAEVLGKCARDQVFALGRSAEADRECHDRKAELAADEGANRRGVDAAGQERAERHVGNQPAPNAARENVLELIGKIVHRPVAEAREAGPELVIAPGRDLRRPRRAAASARAAAS